MMYVIVLACAAAISAWLIYKGYHWNDEAWEAFDNPELIGD